MISGLAQSAGRVDAYEMPSSLDILVMDSLLGGSILLNMASLSS